MPTATSTTRPSSTGDAEGELAADAEDGDGEDDARARVFAWAREAVEAAGMVRRPRGANAGHAALRAEASTASRGEARRRRHPPGPPLPRRLGRAAQGLRLVLHPPRALSVPLAQRALEPLCYERDGDRLVPRTPEEILDLKVCEPAMGSGSFLVAALRYLVEALHRSLRAPRADPAPKDDRETVVTLPFGAPATGEEHEELFRSRPRTIASNRCSARVSRATSSSAASTASTSTRWRSSSLASRSGSRPSIASCRSSTSTTSSRSATASSAAGFTSSTTTRSAPSIARTATARPASGRNG